MGRPDDPQRDVLETCQSWRVGRRINVLPSPLVLLWLVWIMGAPVYWYRGHSTSRCLHSHSLLLCAIVYLRNVLLILLFSNHCFSPPPYPFTTFDPSFRLSRSFEFVARLMMPTTVGGQSPSQTTRPATQLSDVKAACKNL